jgi:hypothetical protein
MGHGCRGAVRGYESTGVTVLAQLRPILARIWQMCDSTSQISRPPTGQAGTGVTVLAQLRPILARIWQMCDTRDPGRKRSDGQRARERWPRMVSYG